MKSYEFQKKTDGSRNVLKKYVFYFTFFIDRFFI